MKKHYLLTLVATLALGLGVEAQSPDTLTVAEGSTMSENLPISHNFPDGLQHSQMIYPAEMLQELEGSMITALSFHMMYATTIYNGSPTIVRLGTTTQTTFAAADTTLFLPTAGMTVVFDDTLHTDSLRLPIVFSEPYLYSGGNLVIDFYYDGAGPMFGAGGHFFGMSTGQRTGMMMYYYPEYDESDVYGPFMLPTVDFIYGEGGDVCLTPINLTATNITPHGMDLSWTPRNASQTYVISIGGEVVEESWTSATYTATGLDPETEYAVSVRAVCGEGDTSAELAGNFTTGIACPAPTGLTVDSVDATFLSIRWNGSEGAYGWQVLLDGQVVEENWGDTTYTLPGLTHSRAYHIGLRAVCGDEGNSQLADTVVATACATIDELGYVIDFEDNYIGCWTVVNGNWSVDAGTANALTHGGNRMLRDDIAYNSAGPHTIRMPNIEVPVPGEGVQLSWYAAGQNSYLSATQPCTYEVIIAPNTPGGTDSVVLRDTLTINNDYHQGVLDLSPYAGMTISVGFRHTTAQVSGVRTYLVIDDIRLSSTEQPEPVIGRYSYRYGSTDACVMVGDEAHFEGWLAGGSESGLVYSWSSAMATAGLATLNADDGTLTVVYSAAGHDTITLTATNSYGSASATLGVVVDNFSLTNLPFNATFNITSTYAQEFAKWCNINLDGTGTSAFRLVTQSHSGIYAVGSYALPDSGQTDAMLISPAIAVPTTAMNMSLLYYVRGNSADEASPATYDVLVSTSGRSSYAYFTDTILHDTVSGGTYVRRSIPLSGYAGDTVYLAFRHTSRGAQSLMIDDIAIREAAEPVVGLAPHPSVVDAGDTVVLTAILEEGLNEDVVYGWTSSMFTAGQADTLMLEDSVMAIVYNAGGIDHISVSVANTVGSDSLGITLTVRNCQPIDALPWQPVLANADMLCWDIIDANHDNRTWMTTSDGKLYSRFGDYGSDDWAITPAIVIPADGDSVVLDYIVEGNEFDSLLAHYVVLVSPSASAQPEAFTDTLLVEDIDSTDRRIIALGDYAGDTIRIAFRHVNSGDDNGIRIGNLSVREFNPPLVVIEAPETAMAESDAQFHAVLVNGNSDTVTYTWTSTMAAAGLATLSPNGADLVISYLGAGTDTVSVTADNGYGTSTATSILQVAPAPCHQPTNLALDSAGSDFLAFSWLAGGDESEWEVGINDDVVIVGQTSYTATGLTPSTAYIVSVRAICSEGDTSLEVSALFYTADSTPTPPVPPDTNSIATTEVIGFSLYPNPASQTVTVGSAAAADVVILDLNGREVYRSLSAATSHRIDVTSMARGAYFVRLTSAGATVVRKLIIR